MDLYGDLANHFSWGLGLGFCTSLLASLFLLNFLGRKIISSTAQTKLPPGSTGWPFLGETVAFMKQTNSAQNRTKFIDEHQRRYGPIFRCNLFGKPQMIVSVDPDFNKYVLQNEGRLFESNPPASASKLFGKYGFLTVHGELQRKLHATAVNLLKYEKLSSEFMDDIQHVFLSAMEKWQDKTVIRLQDFCNQIVLNLMGKKLLDLQPGEEMERICKTFQEYVKALLVMPINIPGTAYYRGYKARKIIINKIYECIKDRRQHPDVARNDLLTKLVREEMFSDEIMADLILFLMVAGFETSSSAMAVAVKFLTATPRALEELRAEHHGILKNEGKLNQNLTWDDYASMKFTQCVIKETLRMASAAPSLFKDAKEDITFKDYVIPKGWTVMVFLSGMHLDSKLHSEPLTFDPWRWQNEEEVLDNPSYMPFGRGARLCPGLHLARFEMALFLHHFVTKFRWETVGKDSAVYFPHPSFAKGFPIRVYRGSA